jgi:hypothetical protein
VTLGAVPVLHLLDQGPIFLPFQNAIKLLYVQQRFLLHPLSGRNLSGTAITVMGELGFRHFERGAFAFLKEDGSPDGAEKTYNPRRRRR